MEKKKIIFFIYELGGGGAARTFVNIANHLNETIFEPIIVTLNYNGTYEKYVHPHVKIVKLPTKRLRSAILPFSRYIKEVKPDIVFSTIPNYNTFAIISRLLSRTKAKSVVREAAYLGGSFFENVRLIFYGRMYRFAKRIVALSEGVKENVSKRYLVAEKKIEVIYNPIDLQNIREQAIRIDMPKEHEDLFTKDRKIIVTAGRLVKEKDQATLIRAFVKVNEEIPSSLLILGEGILKEDLITLTKKLNIAEHVHFIGFQQNPYQYFHKADLFALSSITEGFGHVLVEALATDTIVATTDCKPGSTEVLQDGEFGFISPVGKSKALAENMITALSLSEKDEEQLIARARLRAEEFSAEQIVKQYEEVFLQVLGVDN